MTTFFNFQPSPTAPFQFQPVLDGSPYVATVPWLAFGRRFYLDLVAADGTPILYTALAGSPTGVAIQALSWLRGRAFATTVAPHGYQVGRVVSLTVVGCLPAAYNGIVAALITGPNTFSWSLPANPGAATVLGNANYDVNLLGGVPNVSGQVFTSTLVFRSQSQQFEVN